MPVNRRNVKSRKQTLLQKYDMLVDCLSFEHIEKCCNIKELEKILKILRSGEEGHYPLLETAAEDKLQKLCPNNHLLRVETPVIPTSSLGTQEKQQVSNEMQTWAQEMSSIENSLKSEESVVVDNTPAVRNSSVSRTVSEKNKMNKATSSKTKDKALRTCVPHDYDFWDKFDADSEVLKMDLEEERHSEQKIVERKQQEEIQKHRNKLSMEEDKALSDRLCNTSDGAEAGDGLSVREKEFNSLQEKCKGNEYFRNQDLVKAIEHYSKSVAFLPNADAFNNRAQAYLKLGNSDEMSEKKHSYFTSAVEDCKSAIMLDPRNVKAYYRQGSALFSLEKYHDALDKFEKALEIEPDNKSTQEYIQKLREKLGIPISSKKVRLPIQMKISSAAVEEVSTQVNRPCSDDKYYPFFPSDPNEDFALNAIGTAKVMCRCSGKPGFMKKVNSLEDIKDHDGRHCMRRNSRSHKKHKTHVAQHSVDNQKTVDVIMDSSCQKSKEEYFANNKDVDDATENSNLPPHKFKSKNGTQNLSSKNDALSNLEKQKTPFSFSVFWSSIKNINDLPSVAKALRVLSPEQIAQVVGNKLEEKMLSVFILALRAHFSLPDEWGVVQKYLHSFTQLPRFSFVNMMLDKGTKKELELLLNDAERLGLRILDLLQLYGLTSSA